jgi:hypothetical protein
MVIGEACEVQGRRHNYTTKDIISYLNVRVLRMNRTEKGLEYRNEVEMFHLWECNEKGHCK